MSEKSRKVSRLVRAVHGVKELKPDPEYETGMAEYLKIECDQDTLIQLYSRFIKGDDKFNSMMRRILFRALTRSLGHSISIGGGVEFKHPETFEIGNNVFIGAQAYIQGRHDGNCSIGDNVWIGPQSYFDARDLVIEENVGWGPGAKVLGSTHTGVPIEVPIIQTDLEIKRVRIGAWADVGTNAVVLPGVSIGKGSIVGAGAVVTRDILPFSIVAGVPAKFLRWRDGYQP